MRQLRITPMADGEYGASLARYGSPKPDLKLRVSQLSSMLIAANTMGLRRRRLVQFPLLGCAVALVSAGVACAICSAYLAQPASVLLQRGQTLCTMSALPCFLAALQPGDTRAVRAALVAYAVTIACLGGLNAHRFARMCLEVEATGCDRARLDPQTPCAWSELSSQAFVLLTALVDVVAALAAMRAAASPLSTRARIKRLWFIAGIAACALAISLLLTIVVQAALFSYAGADQLAVLAGSLVLACVYGLNALFALSGWFRMRVQGCIEARGEAVQRAAIISALIGGRSAEQALALAHDSFRAIKMDALCAADLASNDAETSARLYARSTPVQYGEVDVFVSHSWSDDPAAKWKALSEWGAEFAQAHGRPARVWLDSACLDQTEFRREGSLERVLACLPIYLAGSRSFLVLSGPSWHTRLWCLLEAFTWTQMHAQGEAGRGPRGAEDVHRITVRLLGRTDAESAEICDAISSLETGVARCSTEAHRALLLDMIECGAHGLHDFDVALRELLRDALERAAAHECLRAAAAAAAAERSESSRNQQFRRPSSIWSIPMSMSDSFRSKLSTPRPATPPPA